MSIPHNDCVDGSLLTDELDPSLVYSTPPSVRLLSDILPEDPLLMMGAGPVPIPDAVAHANSVVINHLGSTMSTIISQVKEMARYVFQTRSEWVLGVAGPGSSAMEMAICNLVRPDTKVLCIVNGFFSARMAEMSRRLGANVVIHEVDGPHAARADEVEKEILRHKPEVITIVHGETSNTILNRELPEIARIAKQHGSLIVVDAVCTLSTTPLQMDDWHIDAVITGGQKGLSSIPGVSLIAFSDDAWARVNANASKVNTHWTLDAKLAENFWHKGGYHYTAPVSGVLALHEALRLVCKETLPLRFTRHLRSSLALQHGIEALGLTLFAPKPSRLNSVVGINMPDSVTNNQVCSHISNRYRVEISGSFGLPIVRIGQMGEQCRAHNLFRTLHAFGSTMRDLGVDVNLSAAMATLQFQMQDHSHLL